MANDKSIGLGNRVVGAGPVHAIVLNDWIGDTTTWDPILPLFDVDRFSWAFADLRGYGRSRGIAGDHGIEEAAGDVLRTADTLGWPRFSIIAHSMSTLVALHIGQRAADRIDRIALIAPGPPAGIGADDATADYLRSVALGDPAQRLAGLNAMWGDRLSKRWTMFKAERWQATSDPDAVAAYVDMFAQQGLPDQERPVSVPVLAITGEEDAEIMRGDAVRQALSPLCRSLQLQPIGDAGHYPMQEAPALTYTFIERFLEAVE